MHVEFRRREPGSIEFGFIYGLIALFLLAVARFFPLLQIAPDCAFHALTGFPCPTCGATRALVLFSRGHFLPAFAMNPLFIAALAAAVFALFYSLCALAFDLPRAKLILSSREKDVLRFVVVLALLADWVYLSSVL